jgi:hypothetical protein
MLTAILNGKAGRIQLDGVEHRVRWSDIFRRSEDLLTSVIFGRFRYLSEESQTKFMTLLIGEKAANAIGRIVDADFWPSLSGRSQGRTRVEPDMLLQFEHALVMIEIKPPFGGGQYLNQWRAQVHALAEKFSDDSGVLPGQVHFIGLGRNTFQVKDQTYDHFDTRGLFELELHTSEWQTISNQLPVMISDATPSDAAVFQDWMTALELFGIYRPRPTWLPLFEWSSKNILSLDVIKDWADVSIHNVDTDSPQTPNPWVDLIVFSKTIHL